MTPTLTQTSFILINHRLTSRLSWQRPIRHGLVKGGAQRINYMPGLLVATRLVLWERGVYIHDSGMQWKRCAETSIDRYNQCQMQQVFHGFITSASSFHWSNANQITNGHLIASVSLGAIILVGLGYSGSLDSVRADNSASKQSCWVHTRQSS